MKIEEGKLKPGECLGDYYIGMEKKEVLKIIGNRIVERSLADGGSIIILENAKIWFDKDELIRQIGVSKGFKGKYKRKVGIGTTLSDVKDYFGGYEYCKDTYNIVGVDGMCFELEDIDEWDEMTAPIEWIFIYKTDKK